MSRFSLIFLGASLLVVMLVLVSGPEQVEAGKSKKQLLAFALLSLLNRGKKIVVPIPLPLPVPVVDKKKHYVTKESIPMPLPVYSRKLFSIYISYSQIITTFFKIYLQFTTTLRWKAVTGEKLVLAPTMMRLAMLQVASEDMEMAICITREDMAAVLRTTLVTNTEDKAALVIRVIKSFDANCF